MLSLEEKLSTLALLQAMYPLPSEIVFSPPTAALLHAYNEDGQSGPSTAGLYAVVNVKLSTDSDTRLAEVEINMPASADPTIGLKQPGWLTRAEYDQICRGLPRQDDDGDLIGYLGEMADYLREEAPRIMACKATTSATVEDAVSVGKEERVWFWFPSLSSKEKRRDLVDYAGGYGLTGFVLAGMPRFRPPRMARLYGGCIAERR